MTVTISEMTEADWPAVSAIYQEGIDTGDATFQKEPPETWQEWRSGKMNPCSIVAREKGRTVGWAALNPVSNRSCYTGVAEVSLYVAQESRGRGLGSQLLRSLIDKSEACGVWTLQAGIFPENEASLHVHRKHGFRDVGIREKLGRMEFGPLKGRWRDVILLERRSALTGTD
ncbi:MAG: N-acetyltransferase [Deltaproteobacteria bacterium]|nr:N-acetyltransferase [Deltaproteobacteria bacterium]